MKLLYFRSCLVEISSISLRLLKALELKILNFEVIKIAIAETHVFLRTIPLYNTISSIDKFIQDDQPEYRPEDFISRLA